MVFYHTPLGPFLLSPRFCWAPSLNNTSWYHVEKYINTRPMILCKHRLDMSRKTIIDGCADWSSRMLGASCLPTLVFRAEALLRVLCHSWYGRGSLCWQVGCQLVFYWWFSAVLIQGIRYGLLECMSRCTLSCSLALGSLLCINNIWD